MTSVFVCWVNNRRLLHSLLNFDHLWIFYVLWNNQIKLYLFVLYWDSKGSWVCLDLVKVFDDSLKKKTNEKKAKTKKVQLRIVILNIPFPTIPSVNLRITTSSTSLVLFKLKNNNNTNENFSSETSNYISHGQNLAEIIHNDEESMDKIEVIKND